MRREMYDAQRVGRIQRLISIIWVDADAYDEQVKVKRDEET